MNEIVMYNNDLNSIVLPESFTDTELRIFFAIVSRLRNKGTTEVTFPYAYLRDITKDKSRATKKDYAQMVANTYHKLLGLRFVYSNMQVEGEINLFQGYEKDKSDNSFTISVSPKFQYIFNDLVENGTFTAWSLDEFCDLPGIYTKNLYRLLKQWKYVGHASFLIKDFREFMGVPEKYETKELTRRVINPAVSKLIMYTDEFKTLRYEYSSKKSFAVRVMFTWQPEKRQITSKNTRKSYKKPISVEEVPIHSVNEVSLEYSNSSFNLNDFIKKDK